MSSDWNKIDQICQAALELEPDRREAFVSEACGDDKALHQEVESLLSFQSQSLPFIEKPAFQVMAEKLAEVRTRSLEGRQIGAYRIDSLIGAGGMGEVYKAKDTRLNRTVAIKVLPNHFAERADLRQRFEREARAIASLSHPHICPLFDIGNQDGVDFLVMEFLEGETLSQRLKKGRLPPQQILQYAIEMASALDQAHRRGVIHRDLKPGNIMLTETGARLLDFGLAKHTGGAGAPHTLIDARGSARPTQAESITQEGMILGTLEYMAPEQVEGKEADARTDIFALGVVIYEMATGRKAFEGNSKASVIAKILTFQPPPISSIQPLTPSALDRVVRRCLAKEPDDRWQTAKDLMHELKWVTYESSISAPKASPRWLKRAALLIPLLFVLMLAFYLWNPFPSPPPKVTNSVQLTHETLWKGPIVTDGIRLYFSMANATMNFSIFQLPVSGGVPVPFPSPFGSTFVIGISPDGSELLVCSQDSQTQDEKPLWILPTLGGSPRRLGETFGHNGAWSPDGQEIAYVNGKDLYLVKSDGTQSRKLVTLPGIGTVPRWSPDRRRLCVSVEDPKEENTTALWEVDREGRNFHTMLSGWHDSVFGSWTPDGRYFLFVSANTLWARREKPGNKPVQLTFPPSKVWQAVPNKDGKKIFIAETGQPRQQMIRYEPGSGRKSDFLTGVSANELRFSRDGNWVAYLSMDGSLWRGRADGSEKLQLTFPPLHARCPHWSPDGKQISFFSEGNKETDKAYVVSAQGGNPQPLIPDQKEQYMADWFPDGNAMIFGWPWPSVFSDEPASSSATVIYYLDLKTHQVSKLTGSEGLSLPRLSQDGRHLTASLHFGQPDQKLMLFDFKKQKWEELAAVQAFYREWSHDSRYLYFSNIYEKVPGIFRVRISDRKVERVCTLEESGASGNAWFGLAPDDSILVLRDLSTQEIFALDWEAP